MNNYFELLFVFFTATFMFYIFSSIRDRKRKINKRIDTFIPLKTQKVENVEDTKQNESKIKDSLHSMSKPLEGIKFSKKTEIQLEQAGSFLTPAEFLVVRLLTGIGTWLIFLTLGFHFFLCIIASVIGLLIPRFYMKRKAKKRLDSLSFQLVEALATMSNSLRAGFSLPQAMQLVGKEMPDPIGPEFDRVVREVGLGVPIEEVFSNLIKRLPNRELEVVVQAMLAQRKSGGNLAELLETMEETIRGRIRILEELKTLTAQGILSSWVITFLPVGLGLYMYIVNPDYFSPMLEHPLGIFMLVAGAMSIIIGWFLIQRVVRIEV